MTSTGISLSTHVLDTGVGKPAGGVLIVLYRGDMFMTEARSDGDGRARLGDDLDPGTYRLVFHPPSPFFKRVELEIQLDEGHYHVPLLISPYSCASYRGS